MEITPAGSCLGFPFCRSPFHSLFLALFLSCYEETKEECLSLATVQGWGIKCPLSLEPLIEAHQLHVYQSLSLVQQFSSTGDFVPPPQGV